ncbi:MAG: hypothetical protein KY434_00095 [Actinobacteria bacterium]|nr:hypothetical protein [Actinomycetota bacterium]
MSGIILLTVTAAVAALGAAAVAALRLRATVSDLLAAAGAAGERSRGAVDELRAELAVASLEADALRRRWQSAPPGRRGTAPPGGPAPG